MKYKGGKRTDRGPISYRVKGRRLKVNASKSYPVHLTCSSIVFFNTFRSRAGGEKEKMVISLHLCVFKLDMVTTHVI